MYVCTEYVSKHYVCRYVGQDCRMQNVGVGLRDPHHFAIYLVSGQRGKQNALFVLESLYDCG